MVFFCCSPSQLHGACQWQMAQPMWRIWCQYIPAEGIACVSLFLFISLLYVLFVFILFFFFLPSHCFSCVWYILKMRQKDFFYLLVLHLFICHAFFFSLSRQRFEECLEKAADVTDRVSGSLACYVQRRMWSVAQFSKSFLSWWLHCRVSRCCREIFKVLCMVAVPPPGHTHTQWPARGQLGATCWKSQQQQDASAVLCGWSESSWYWLCGVVFQRSALFPPIGTLLSRERSWQIRIQVAVNV